MELGKAREEFKHLQKRISAINHAVNLIFFDGETSAPSDTADNRIKSLEVLNDVVFQLQYGDQTMELVDFLWEQKDELTIYERRSLELLKRSADKRKNVTKEQFLKYENLLISAQDALHKANEDQNYEIYLPYLQKVFDCIREFAVSYDNKTSPYDYCLDIYEPGMNSQIYDTIFDEVKRSIIPLLQKIKEKPQVSDDCLKGDFSVDSQEELAIYIMDLLRLNMDRVGLATGEHPFTKTMGSHLDARIVTKYSRKDFSSSLYNMLYECGSILYETGQDDNVIYTFMDGSASLGIMESQTRFYENIVGRSRGFIEFLYPKLKELFPETVGNYSPEDLYLAVNKVEAGPVRLGSDEITNNLHVLVRYELEKALMNGDLLVKDLPDAWAEKYKEYLGIDVPNPTEGILQDIHWACGDIGYFPTAVLGNSYSAIIAKRMREDLNLEACIREGNFEPINQWNKSHIWEQVCLYDTKDVMSKYINTTLNGESYVKYLNEKYTNIYNL